MKDFKEIIAEQIAKATNIEKDKIIPNIEVPVLASSLNDCLPLL